MISHKLKPDIETASDEYAKRFSGDVGKFFIDIQTEITLNIVKSITKDVTILDIGGGHGQIATPLAERGYNVTVTSSYIDACQNSLRSLVKKKKVNFLASDLISLPFADNQFDVVMAFRLLPHMAKWERLLEEMSRVAKNMIIFDYPDLRSCNIMYKLLFSAKRAFEVNTRPFTLFSRSEIRTVMRGLGWGQYSFRPEFFAPMVVHRFFSNACVSRNMESLFSFIGVTKVLGSPIIASFTK